MVGTVLLPLLLTAGSFANEEPTAQDQPVEESSNTPDEAEEDSTETPEVLAPTLDGTEKLSDVTKKDLEFFQPKHHLHEQNPYGQTDFTAYTLEWGEVKLGLASITLGILPRTQLGTIPVLDVLGIPNVNLKVNIFRIGPLDVGLMGDYYELSLGDFKGTWMAPGAMASVRLAEPVSLHFGGKYVMVSADGYPDITQLPSLLTGDINLDEWEQTLGQLQAEGGNLSLQGQVVNLKAALDFRLNRRDSFVLQFGGMAGARAEGNLFVPVLNLDKVLDPIEKSFEWNSTLMESYMVTLSYQGTFKKFDLRFGGGGSSFPFAWILQANDLSYRFGGATRWKEKRENKGWKKNLKDI